MTFVVISHPSVHQSKRNRRWRVRVVTPRDRVYTSVAYRSKDAAREAAEEIAQMIGCEILEGSR